MTRSSVSPVLRVLSALAAICLAPAALACGGGLHLEIGPSGIYTLDHAAATAVQPGLDGCPVEQLRLRSRGEEVTLRVLDDGDGVFGAGDRIEWIGEKLHGPESWSDPYSLVNVYELDAAPGERLRYALRPAGDDTGEEPRARMRRSLHLEEDTMVMRLERGQVQPREQPDLWYWAKLTMVDAAPFTTRFDLSGVARDAGDPVRMRLAFRGWSTVRVPDGEAAFDDHVVEVRVNDTPVGELAWGGRDHIEHALDVPAGLLKEHGNTLTLTVPPRTPGWAKNPAVDVVMFDYLDLDYAVPAPGGEESAPLEVVAAGVPSWRAGAAPELFGSDGVVYLPTSEPGRPARYAQVAAGTVLHPLASGAATLSPAGMRALTDDRPDLRNPATGHDYIIVAHPSLLEATRPLVAFHRERGLDPILIDVTDVYDQFNHGIVNPRAIRQLLEHAWEAWPAPRPRYVLLVGDASFDIHDAVRDQKFYAKWTSRDLLQPGHFNSIPSTSYADAPEAANARNLIPAFQYFGGEGQSASDNGFVTFDPESDKPFLAIGRLPVVLPEEVSAIVEKIIRYVREPRMGSWRQSVMFITNDEVHFQRTSDEIAAKVGELGFSAAKVYPSTEDADNLAHQARIKQELNDGQLLVHFLGHGGRYIWRTGPPDPVKNHDLFTLDDISDLDNLDHMPMILSMTCFSAPFDNPTEDSIGEKFLREADKGAIAVFAASWRNAPDVSFSKQLMRELVTPGVPIGDAILTAKQETNNPEMIGMYNLLGDPSIALQRPQEQLQMMQVRERWNPGVAVRVPGTSDFSGNVRVTWLDADQNELSETTYAVHAPQWRLPAAPAGAHAVRVYALDPDHAADALGELTLTEEKPRYKRPWWKPRPKPKPLPPAADRIHGDNFGG